MLPLDNKLVFIPCLPAPITADELCILRTPPTSLRNRYDCHLHLRSRSGQVTDQETWRVTGALQPQTMPEGRKAECFKASGLGQQTLHPHFSVFSQDQDKYVFDLFCLFPLLHTHWSCRIGMEEGERAAVVLEEGLGQGPRSCDTIFALNLLRVAGAGVGVGGRLSGEAPPIPLQH